MPATWYHFFLDFPADMSDDLFKPAQSIVLTDLYPVGLQQPLFRTDIGPSTGAPTHPLHGV
jgi:hypothetical protein